MRTIKFRGLRKNYNPEYGQSEWKYGNLLNNQTIGEVGSNLESYEYADVIPETVGQYTGLKDKNEKEIYEGDIVEWQDKGSNYPNTIHKKEVVKYIGCTFENCNSIYPLEVIGNIHQNPELINKAL